MRVARSSAVRCSLVREQLDDEAARGRDPSSFVAQRRDVCASLIDHPCPLLPVARAVQLRGVRIWRDPWIWETCCCSMRRATRCHPNRGPRSETSTGATRHPRRRTMEPTSRRAFLKRSRRSPPRPASRRGPRGPRPKPGNRAARPRRAALTSRRSFGRRSGRRARHATFAKVSSRCTRASERSRSRTSASRPRWYHATH